MLVQVALIAIATILTLTSICVPNALSDSGNAFLRGFVNQELLATLGVIVSITLVSAGAIHIELVKLAKEMRIDVEREKRAVRNSAFLLIWLLLAALILVVLKPIVALGERPSAFANALGLMILIWAIAVLYDLTRAAFTISR
jgi:hypothetical protein